MRYGVYSILILPLAGCLPGPMESELVPSNPFRGPNAPVSNQAIVPVSTHAAEEASLRVLKVGQKVLAANPQMSLKPIFSTIGSSTSGTPAEEVFHTGQHQVIITESLVRQCK